MTTKSAKNLRDDVTEERAHRHAGTDPAEMENLAAARVTELSAQTRHRLARGASAMTDSRFPIFKFLDSLLP